MRTWGCSIWLTAAIATAALLAPQRSPNWLPTYRVRGPPRPGLGAAPTSPRPPSLDLGFAPAPPGAPHSPGGGAVAGTPPGKRTSGLFIRGGRRAGNLMCGRRGARSRATGWQRALRAGRCTPFSPPPPNAGFTQRFTETATPTNPTALRLVTTAARMRPGPHTEPVVSLSSLGPGPAGSSSSGSGGAVVAPTTPTPITGGGVAMPPVRTSLFGNPLAAPASEDRRRSTTGGIAGAGAVGVGAAGSAVGAELSLVRRAQTARLGMCGKGGHRRMVLQDHFTRQGKWTHIPIAEASLTLQTPHAPVLPVSVSAQSGGIVGATAPPSGASTASASAFLPVLPDSPSAASRRAAAPWASGSTTTSRSSLLPAGSASLALALAQGQSSPTSSDQLPKLTSRPSLAKSATGASSCGVCAGCCVLSCVL